MSEQAVDAPPEPHAPLRVAARTVDVSKTYGTGDAAVTALDHVSVDLYEGEFTAVMGPSGSGKSTLMHCLAALDDVTSGQVFVAEVELTTLKDKELTRLRRDRIGFVFQSFNLVPTLTAEENITLPLSIAGRKPDRSGTARSWRRWGSRTDSGTARTRSPGASSSAWRSPGRWPAGRPSSSRTSRRATSTRARAAEVLSLLRRSVDEFGQTVVMVTHDPVAAAFTDRVLFLADGRVVDELRRPTREQVLDTMTRMDARQLDAVAVDAAVGRAGHVPGVPRTPDN